MPNTETNITSSENYYGNGWRICGGVIGAIKVGIGTAITVGAVPVVLSAAVPATVIALVGASAFSAGIGDIFYSTTASKKDFHVQGFLIQSTANAVSGVATAGISSGGKLLATGAKAASLRFAKTVAIDGTAAVIGNLSGAHVKLMLDKKHDEYEKETSAERILAGFVGGSLASGVGQLVNKGGSKVVNTVTEKLLDQTDDIARLAVDPTLKITTKTTKVIVNGLVGGVAGASGSSAATVASNLIHNQFAEDQTANKKWHKGVAKASMTGFASGSIIGAIQASRSYQANYEIIYNSRNLLREIVKLPPYVSFKTLATKSQPAQVLSLQELKLGLEKGSYSLLQIDFFKKQAAIIKERIIAQENMARIKEYDKSIAPKPLSQSNSMPDDFIFRRKRKKQSTRHDESSSTESKPLSDVVNDTQKKTTPYERMLTPDNIMEIYQKNPQQLKKLIATNQFLKKIVILHKSQDFNSIKYIRENYEGVFDHYLESFELTPQMVEQAAADLSQGKGILSTQAALNEAKDILQGKTDTPAVEMSQPEVDDSPIVEEDYRPRRHVANDYDDSQIAVEFMPATDAINEINEIVTNLTHTFLQQEPSHENNRRPSR